MYFFYILLCFLITTPALRAQIVDSDMTLSQALSGQGIPDNIQRELNLLDVKYYSFDGKIHKGQLVVHRSVSEDVREVFEIMLEEKFPIARVIPVQRYDWSDELSMKDNNTSAFNYRRVKGTRIMSKHSYGRAIDINPQQNPFFKRGKYSPAGAVYRKDQPGTLTAGSRIVKEFKKRGWRWGGEWRSSKDYQHFEK
ncbi:MAG: M15 family metallopeptidase [Bacteroidota bacterium]